MQDRRGIEHLSRILVCVLKPGEAAIPRKPVGYDRWLGGQGNRFKDTPNPSEHHERLLHLDPSRAARLVRTAGRRTVLGQCANLTCSVDASLVIRRSLPTRRLRYMRLPTRILGIQRLIPPRRTQRTELRDPRIAVRMPKKPSKHHPPEKRPGTMTRGVRFLRHRTSRLRLLFAL